LGVAQHVDAVHGRGAGGRPGQGGEDLDGGGLAGAVRPEQAEDGSGGDGDVQPVEGADVAVGFHKVTCLDGTHGSLPRETRAPGYGGVATSATGYALERFEAGSGSGAATPGPERSSGISLQQVGQVRRDL